MQIIVPIAIKHTSSALNQIQVSFADITISVRPVKGYKYKRSDTMVLVLKSTRGEGGLVSSIHVTSIISISEKAIM